MSELEVELEKLSSALEERGAQLRDIIKEEKQRKEAELEVRLWMTSQFFLDVFNVM